jgi:hypothetical protein
MHIRFVIAVFFCLITSSCHRPSQYTVDREIDVSNPILAVWSQPPIKWSAGLPPGVSGKAPLPEGSAVEKRSFSEDKKQWEDWDIKLPSGEMMLMHFRSKDSGLWATDVVALKGNFSKGNSLVLTKQVEWGMTPEQVGEKLMQPLKLENTKSEIRRAVIVNKLGDGATEITVVLTFDDEGLRSVQSYQEIFGSKGEHALGQYYKEPYLSSPDAASGK